MKHLNRIALSFIITIISSVHAFGGKVPIDTLLANLDKCDNLTDSINLMCQLTWRTTETNKAQAEKYSLLALEKSKMITDSTIITDVYSAVAYYYMLEQNYEKSREYYHNTLEIAKRNNIVSGINWTYFNLIELELLDNNYDDAVKYTRLGSKGFYKEQNYRMTNYCYWLLVEAGHKTYLDTIKMLIETESTLLPEETNTVYFYIQQGSRFNEHEDRRTAMLYIQKAMDLAEKVDDSRGLIKAYIQISRYLSQIQGNHEMALKYIEKALEKVTDINGDFEGQLYVDMGEKYKLMGNDSMAFENFTKALQIGKERKHKHSISKALIKLGDMHYQQCNYSDALYYFTKSYETNCDVCPPISFHHVLIHIGNVHLFDGEPEKALEFYTKSLELAESASDNKTKIDSYQAFANYYSYLGNKSKATDYYKNALNLSKEHGLLEQQHINAVQLSNIFTAQGNYKQGLEYLTLANTLSDSLNNANQADNLARLETYFDFKNLQTQQELEQAKTNEEIVRQKLLNRFYFLAFVIASILVFLIYFSYRRKKKDNKLLQEQKQEIENMSRKVHEADQAKLQFFTNISHEFKTPITIILGMTEKLKSVVANYQPVDVIRKSSFKLLVLINHLLDLRKIDTSNMKLAVKEGNINEFVGGLVASFEHLAASKSIRLNFHGSMEQCESYFDHDKVEKIVSNLLSNAIKYTQKGGAVTVLLSVKNSGYVTVEIADTGLGIPKNELEQIFSRFYRVSESNAVGTGIGLSLVKELVSIHKGEINVESILGKGTNFKVEIPTSREHYTISEITKENYEKPVWENIETDSVEDELIASDNLDVISPDKASILVVEDNQDLRRFIADIFLDDFEVLQATNGDDGCKMAIKYVPDIIISDIMMPGKTGLQLVECLRNEIATSHIPIILLTAKSDVTTRLDSFEKGADDYINKPFDSAVLKSRVYNLLRMRKQLVEKFSSQFHLQPRDVKIEDADKKFLQNTIDLIEKHISNPNLNIDLLTAELGISRTQLYRKLNALTDYPPKHFIRVIRLKRAAQIIKEGQNNMAEVMDATGFSNYSHFNSCFKELFGEYPKDYALINVGVN